MAVRWWPHTDDPRVASFRLRCARIVDRLAASGMDAGLYRPARSQPPRVLVLSKRYDGASLAHALSLRERAGTRVVLDLCDNHFHVDNDDTRLLARADALRDAVRSVDEVVAASQALAEVIAAECPAQRRIIVIPDATEPPFEPGAVARLSHPADELALRRLTGRLARSGVAQARRLLWFGNHGSAGTEGGMSDLLRIRDDLQRAHREQALSLTVISNDEDKFARLVGGWAMPTFYLPWHAGSFSRAARLHSATVIPVGLNPFTRCKTNNRVATAFLHGLNVVADAIPSYEEFADCAVLDDWPRGLGPYLHDSARRAGDADTGRRRVEERYSLDAMIERWRDVAMRVESAGGNS